MLRELEELDRKPATLDNYRSMLRVYLLPRFGAIPVDQVATREVEALAAQMLRDGKAAQTRAHVLKLLSQVFNFAERCGWCAGNPCERVRWPRVLETADIRFLDHEELETLLAAVDTRGCAPICGVSETSGQKFPKPWSAVPINHLQPGIFSRRRQPRRTSSGCGRPTAAR